ncbi:tetratricopeptide repeat protein [Epilithonimonas sp.]|uniref:tetratricopeptide repeat protein n=1 Tax=Epilithonimonas sp. TaxID=2894511 RepID=UPI0028A1FBD0|nr:tetratricopeptide repeat protein [Epilithonimonas sp.]
MIPHTFHKSLIYIFFLLFLPFQAFAITPKDCEKMIIEGVEAMNKKDFTKSLQILTKTRKIAQDNKWYREEFLATNNIGANYYMRLDYGEALNNYLDAYKIAVAHLDEKSEMTVLNNIAILYSRDNKIDKAKEYFSKAYELAGKVNNNTSKGLYAINLTIVYNEKGDYKTAKKYIDEALKLTVNSPYYLLAKSTDMETLVNLQKYDEAEKIANELLPKLNGVEYSEHKTQVFYNLSVIAEHKNDLQKSFHYLELAEKSNLNYDFKENLFERFSKLYKKANNIDHAVAYKDSIMAVKDSVNRIKNGQLFENSKIKFELQNSQKDLAESQGKLTTQRSYFIKGILLAIFIIAIIFWALRNSIVKNKQQKIIEQNNAEIAKLELEKEKKNKEILENQLKEKEVSALLEEEKYKNEIEAKNRKLTTKALQLSTKIELIDDLINTLSRESDDLNNVDISNIIKQFKILQKQTHEEESFLVHFEEVNQGFLSRLKQLHPDLNSNDIRFLSYVYMNLSVKEISTIFNITPEACRKRKERITKKIGDDENLDLYTYITSI